MKYVGLGLWMILVWCVGCSGGGAYVIADLRTLPQDAAAYIDPRQADRPLLDDAQQQAAVAQLRQALFAPWQSAGPACTKAQLLQQFQAFHRSGLYSLNRRERPADWADALAAKAHLDTYPNCDQRAITIHNCDLRGLPTVEPCFESFDRAGSGYPFDLLQETALWVGTPLRVRHTTDTGWAFVESPLGSGYLAMKDLAFVDDALAARWQGLPLAAIISEDVPLHAAAPGAMSAHIGTLLPLAGSDERGLTVLVPVADADRKAAARSVTLRGDQACRVPMTMTSRNIARLANRMLGQPYGWGGMYELRDCSSTTHDLLAAFGICLPRNSAQQAQAGQIIPLGDLPPAQRERTILADGKPWRTLLCCPGHVMLYIGQRDGRAIILHNFWGISTRDAGKVGRHIVGGCVITTLRPGIEMGNIALPDGDRRNSIVGMNVLGDSREGGP